MQVSSDSRIQSANMAYWIQTLLGVVLLSILLHFSTPGFRFWDFLTEYPQIFDLSCVIFSWLPSMVTVLAQFNHEKWPISGTVTKTIADFRRTHLDTWEFQKLMFSDEQLEVILSICVSSCFYLLHCVFAFWIIPDWVWESDGFFLLYKYPCYGLQCRILKVVCPFTCRSYPIWLHRHHILFSKILRPFD